MKVDIQMQEESCQITFFTDEFKDKKDYLQALMITESFASDFDIDPQMTEEDFSMLVKEASEASQNFFFVDISEEEVTAEV